MPRLEVEYQVSRAVFLRAVGEYRSAYQDDLRDDARTGHPILIRDPDYGAFNRSLALGGRSNTLRVDWLLSYQPNPGTVFFAGYGSSLEEPRSFRFRGLEPDGRWLPYQAELPLPDLIAPVAAIVNPVSGRRTSATGS